MIMIIIIFNHYQEEEDDVEDYNQYHSNVGENGDEDDKCESKTLTCRVSSRSPTVGGKRTLVSFLLLKIIIIIIIMIVGGKSTLVLMGNLSFSAKIIF